MRTPFIYSIRNRSFPLLIIAIIGASLILVACSDLVTESETGACDKAIDERNYQTALTVCTSRKDKASAYMGLAGYDIVNLMKGSSTTIAAYTAPSNAALGIDSTAGATVLNMLQLGTDKIADDATRTAAITKSKGYLDNASALLHPYLSDNSSPLSKDELILDIFALAFAMQLDQIVTYDNGTTSKDSFPDCDAACVTASYTGYTCRTVDNANTSEAQAVLKPYDGHLWTAEQTAVNCNSIKTAIDSYGGDNKTALFAELATWGTSGGLLPTAIKSAVCDPIDSLTNYLSKLTDSVAKMSLSGDNTKVITDAQSSTDTLLKTVGCKL